MTKKRYLRPCIEKILTTIFTLIFMFLAMIDDFELSAIPILLGLLLTEVFLFYILYKYGRGVWLEHDTEEAELKEE